MFAFHMKLVRVLCCSCKKFSVCVCFYEFLCTVFFFGPQKTEVAYPSYDTTYLRACFCLNFLIWAHKIVFILVKKKRSLRKIVIYKQYSSTRNPNGMKVVLQSEYSYDKLHGTIRG